MIIETEDERQFLLAIIDLALKQGGLQIAPGCVTMAKRIQEYKIPEPVVSTTEAPK